MKINTTYGRSDIEKQQLELAVISVNKGMDLSHAVTAQFNGNNTHRTVHLYSEDAATSLMKSIAKHVKQDEFPWEDRQGARQWKRIMHHDLQF